MKRTTIALLTASLAALLLAVPGSASPSAIPSTSVYVPLGGPWKFLLGDGEFAAEGFDDSSWETRIAPVEGGQEDFDSQNSLAWFRRTFELPADADGADLWLSMGVIDDADQVFLNGTLVAGSGVLPPDPPKTAFYSRRIYDIPETGLRFGAATPNTIAVRINDTGGGGGITTGPLAVLTRDRIASDIFGHGYTTDSNTDVAATLATQEAAIAALDVDAYVATLDDAYFHSGFDRDRERARLTRLFADHPGLRRVDAIVGQGLGDDGSFVVEVRREWRDAADQLLPEWRGSAHAPLDGDDKYLAFLRFDPATGRELGNHDRLLRDYVVSTITADFREFDVYLPPSYFTESDRRYPTVYLLHGAGGNNKEWEIKEIQARLDALVANGAIDEVIVVMPHGRTNENVDTWYADSSVMAWRTYFYDELLPQVDATYRTIDDRTQRGISGWSMGGQGAFTAGLHAPDVFGSIASLSGALSFPPLAGSGPDLVANAPDQPLLLVDATDPLTLRSFCWYLYSGEDDDFAFDEAHRAMQVELAAKTVLVTAEIKASPAYHADHVQLPGLAPSFRLHSNAFGTHDDTLGCEYRVPANGVPTPADDSVELADRHSIRVLDNDTDPDFDPLRLGTIGTPASGTAIDNGDGTITYTPATPAAPVADSFTYEVLDGRGLVATATVSIAAPVIAGGIDDSGGAAAPTVRLPATGRAAPLGAASALVLGFLILRRRRTER